MHTMGKEITSKYLRAEGRKSLEGYWLFGAGTTLAVFFIGFITGMLNKIIPFLGLIISMPLNYGFTILFLRRARKEHVRVENIFDGFSATYYGTIILACIFLAVRVILWSLLLIIPGIIAMLRYSQTFYVIADNPSLGAWEAIEESKRIMKGNLWRYFMLTASFIGWDILAILSLFVGFLWLMPYKLTTYAHFYEHAKKNKSA